MENDSLISAFTNSLTIAVVNMIVSVILGVAAAILLWRFRFPFRFAADGLLSLPIVIPEICMGVAMLVFFNQWWPRDLLWPLSPRQHHHRAHNIHLSLRRRHRARTIGVGQSRIGKGGDGPRRRANGRRCAIFYCRKSARPSSPARSSPSLYRWMISS